MTSGDAPGELRVDFQITPASPREQPRSDQPFRIAILGDFSGRAGRSKPPGDDLKGRRPRSVDRDNLDEVLRRMGVAVELALSDEPGPVLRIELSELEDFHPDRLFERLELFQEVRSLRERLPNPATAKQAAAEIDAERAPSRVDEAPRSTPPAVTATPGGGLLEQILSAAPTAELAARRDSGPSPDLAAFVRRVVAPFTSPADDPRKSDWLAHVDRVTGDLMRAVIHHPRFQEVEAIWRAVSMMVQRLETGSRLSLELIDVSRDELAADLLSAEDPTATWVHRILVDQAVGTPGATPWAIVVGAYRFDVTGQDAALLARLARIARDAGVPFVSDGKPGVVQCPSFFTTPDPDDWTVQPDAPSMEAWAGLRQLPEAAHVGLVAPRFLLRNPYGRDSDPVEGFDFEEIADEPGEADLLWGNPAFLCALLLGRSFLADGWAMRAGSVMQIEGLPYYVATRKGEREAVPCAEMLLTDRAAEAMARRGVMPLASLKNQDSVRLFRFQSMTDPPGALAGPWGR